MIHEITRFTRAKLFSEVGKTTPLFVRFSTVAGERGADDAERDIRSFALKFYTEEGNWDLVEITLGSYLCPNCGAESPLNIEIRSVDTLIEDFDKAD